MKLFLLPGSDVANKEWVERIQPLLGQFANDTQTVHYHHWTTGSKAINLNTEVAAFIDILEEHKGPYGVFAKSAGVFVAMEALAEAAEPPSFAIFAGFPLSFAESQEIDLTELLNTVDYPILFIQNAYDPAGSAEDLRRITNRLENVDFLLLPGNSHDYPILGNTLDAIEDFMAEYK